MGAETPTGEERKLVTVLFADLTESTALGEQLDPERLRVLLRDYFSEMAGVISRWGGIVEKFIGDAVVAVFGVPVAHEDDAERAVGAALQMQERLRELNIGFAERHGVEIGLRVGVNTGEVLAAPGADQLIVTGDAVNVAARLQQRAERGRVIVGERTYRATAQVFAFEELPEQMLKGKSRPARAWRVTGRITEPRRRGIAGAATRLVGRERELGLLSTLYHATVRKRHPHLAVVVGDPGIGKTRLTAEFVAGVEAPLGGASVYTGRCLSYGEGITFWPLRELLWSAAEIQLDDAAAAANEKLRRLVATTFGDADAAANERVLAALALTAGISLPDNPLEQLAPEAVGEELALAWPRFASALAATRPTVLIVEDAHWAEPPLLDMLEHILARATGPLLLVATGRPELTEMRPAWTTKPRAAHIRLEPLAEEHTGDLVHDLLPLVSEHLRAEVVRASEGNPLFAEEIVRHLLDTGALARDAGHVREASAAATIAIPDSVRALIAARIDALDADEKQTLQDASVLGRTFWATPLEAIRRGAGVHRLLASLEQKGLVVTRPSSSLPGHAELTFRHGLIREVAYESIPRAARVRAHAASANWLEELLRERREEFIALIAYHLEAAADRDAAELAWPAEPELREGLRARAVEAIVTAGDNAKTRFEIDQALSFANRALALAVADSERLAALELQAEAAHAGVRANRAWEAYLEALETAQRVGDAVAAQRLRAGATLLWSRYGGAFEGDEWKTRAAELVLAGLAETAGDAATHEAAAFRIGRATFAVWNIAPVTAAAARANAERALEIAEGLESPSLLSHALDSFALITTQDGFCGATEVGERAVDAARRLADRWTRHELLVTAAHVFCDAGHFESAAKAAHESVVEAAALSPHHRLHAGSAATNALARAGRLDELRGLTQHAADLVAEEGMHTCFHGLMALAGQALAAFEAGDDAEAAQALDVLSSVTTPPDDPMAFRYLIEELLPPLRDLEQPRRRLEQLTPPATRTSRVRKLRVDLHTRALARNWEEFNVLAREGRSLARAACAPYLAWMADWGEAVRRAESGDAGGAVADARRATAALAAYGDRYGAARLLLELVPLVPGETSQALARDAAERLRDLGARASATHAEQAART